MGKIGRPTLFTPEIGAWVLELYAGGVQLEAICSMYAWAPSNPATIRDWAEDIPAFTEKFARAHRRHADALAASTITVIAEERDPQRAGVLIKAKQWLAGKYANGVYGEKLEITADHKVSLMDAIAAGQGRLLPGHDQTIQSDSQPIGMIDITPNRSTDQRSGDADPQQLDDLPDWFD